MEILRVFVVIVVTFERDSIQHFLRTELAKNLILPFECEREKCILKLMFFK